MFELLKAVHSNSLSEDDGLSPLDVNGALYIPLSPINISDFDSFTQQLSIEISWPVADSFYVCNGKYTVDALTAGTPYNFTINVTAK